MGILVQETPWTLASSFYTHAEADRIFAALSEGANVEYPFQVTSTATTSARAGRPVFFTRRLVSCPGPS